MKKLLLIFSILLLYLTGFSQVVESPSSDVDKIVVTPDNDGKQDPYDIMMPRINAGDKVWMRCWVKAQNTGTLDFFLGIHEYVH